MKPPPPLSLCGQGDTVNYRLSRKELKHSKVATGLITVEGYADTLKPRDVKAFMEYLKPFGIESLYGECELAIAAIIRSRSCTMSLLKWAAGLESPVIYAALLDCPLLSETVKTELALSGSHRRTMEILAAHNIR